MPQQLEMPPEQAVSHEALPIAASSPSAYADYVNPEWVRLLELLGMNVRYRRCAGTSAWCNNTWGPT